MTVDTQNPMVGGLDEQSSSRAAAGSLSRSLEIARSGKETRQARPRGVEMEREVELLPATSRASGSRFVYGLEMDLHEMLGWMHYGPGQASFCWWTRPCFETETEVVGSKKKKENDCNLFPASPNFTYHSKFKDGDVRSKKK